jgi:hypothetical protein
MDRPFHNRFYEFYTYRDYCDAIPPALRNLPVYLTEANGNGPWQAVGLIPAMLQEIDSWNHSKLPKIHSVIFYRYSTADEDARFAMSTKPAVMAEYQRAVQRGYESPADSILPELPYPPEFPELPELPMPPISIEWDHRLTVRGCTLQPALLVGDDQLYERLRIGRWFDQDEAQGRINIYVRLLDDAGNLAIGVPVTQFWPGGSDTKPTERKRDPWLASMGLGDSYSLDFPMNVVAPAYGIRIDSGNFGDIIDGCGLGSIEQPDYKIHTAYFFEWQLSSEGSGPGTGEPGPLPPILPPWQPEIGRLIWPVPGSITQHFGEGDAQFGQRAHNGIDIACAEGTRVEAICAGEVMYTGSDASYGLYCRVYHPSIHSHSFYAHMVQVDVEAGWLVKQGERLGASGNTGNSTGPHLHFELRAGNKDAYYQGVTFGYTQGRYNPTDAFVLTGSPLTPGAER